MTKMLDLLIIVPAMNSMIMDSSEVLLAALVLHKSAIAIAWTSSKAVSSHHRQHG